MRLEDLRKAGGTIAAAEESVVLSIHGYRGIAAKVTGTWVGTIVSEVSADEGATWDAVDLLRVSDEALIASFTANGLYVFTLLAGVGRVRLRASAWTSGTANIELRGNVISLRDAAGTSAVSGAVDVTDRALRDLGKVDIAGHDVPLPAGTNNIGDVDIASPLGGGTEAAAVRVTLATDGTGLVSVDDNGASLTVDAPVGTPAAVRQSDGAAFIEPRGGNVAHDAVDSGNPMKAGGRAQSAQIAAVADGDRSDVITDRHGNVRTRQGHEAPAASIFPNVHAPAANTRATVTRAAGAAGVRHVATGLTVVLAATVTAPTAVQLNVRLRDGVADTGTILWQAVISLPATAGAMNGIERAGLWIPGSVATAMTLEFSAAGGADTIESVSLESVDITE